MNPELRKIIVLYFCLISGSWLSKVLSESVSEQPYPDASVFSSQRPTINYRTKILGVRYGEAVQSTTPSYPLSSLTPRLTVKSYEEPKTETHAPIYDDEYESSEILEDKSTESTTSRVRQVPPALRRNFPFHTTSKPEALKIIQEESTDKSGKAKSTRRRKVKRPQKFKSSTTPKTVDDDLGIPETNNKSSSGDKNLALEIGSEDGKYALISNFFGNTSASNGNKGPGVISYAQSDDFLNDNEKSLGKLDENDIWLSEGHLLVVKGGDFDSTSRDKWKPIDAYERDKSKPPLRIPLDTDNPPPFPVFVNATGPPIFIGPPPPFPIPGYGEFNESFDPSRLPPPGLIPLYPNGSLPPNFFPPPPGFQPGNNSFPPPPRFPPPGLHGPPSGGGGLYGKGSPPKNSYGNGYGQPQYGNLGNGTLPPPPPPFFPFPPPNGGKNGTFPPPPPFYPFGPPGNGPPPPGFNPNFPPGPGGGPFFPPLVLNPKDNETDDPSIFLPPPYDFDYHEDNTTIVPPGPFAPGLVVPPPKEFYLVYEKTSPKTTTPIFTQVTTPISLLYTSKPQRQNAKKPKFPITSPPDDSLEENLPPTPPSLSLSTIFPKKRKDGRGKSGKSYSLKSSSEEGSSERLNNPTRQVITPIPIQFTPRQVSPTPKPLNYIYVHGKLKTLAEIAAEDAVARGDLTNNVTPTPAFDELGYPNRAAQVSDINAPLEYEYTKKKKIRKPSPKVYFTGQQGHRQISPAEPHQQHQLINQEINPVYPSVNPNLIEITPSVYTPNNNPSILGNQYNSNVNINQQHPSLQNNPNQGQTFFYETNPYYQNTRNPESIPSPPYFNTGTGNSEQKNQNPQFVPNNQQVYQLAPQPQPYYHPHQQQQPQTPTFTSKALQPTVSPYPHQQQSYQSSGLNPPTYNINPSRIGKKRPRSRIIFPDEQDRRPRYQAQQQLQQQQPTPQIYNNPFLYQTSEGQGYYSPVSQYRTALPSPGQFVPNTFYQNPNGNSPGTFTTQFLHPTVQQHQYQQQPQNTYYNIQQFPDEAQGGEVVPLHADILVNYREPLPQYNTESESVTTRSVLKAGPSSFGIFGTQPAGELSLNHHVPQGSFYSFERGGPGGFSYKIQL